jgi:hypothetical protein
VRACALELGPPARTAACAHAAAGTRLGVFASRLQRLGLFAFGVFLLGGTWAARADGAPLLVQLGTGGFGVACVVLATVPRQRRGAREGVERAGDALIFRGGRLRAMAQAVGGLAFTLTCAMLLLGPVGAKLIGGVGALFFGACSVLAARQAVQGSYVALTPAGLGWSGAAGRFYVPWEAIEAIRRTSTNGVQELAIRLRDPAALEGSGIVTALAGFSRRFLGAEVALPLSQLSADPDVVEDAVQRMLAGQPFAALSKSSEQELMQ